MKRTIIASILGIAASAAVSNSYGQGNMIFANYGYDSNGTLYQAPVTHLGVGVNSTYSAQLLYSSTGLAGSFTPVAGAVTAFFGGALAGWFSPIGVTIPTYSGGPAYFEAEYFNGSSFGSSSIVGTSSVFEYSTLATAANLHLAQTPFSYNGDVVTGLTATTVAPVPEPTTLALAGLGGLASLVALRRKQS